MTPISMLKACNSFSPPGGCTGKQLESPLRFLQIPPKCARNGAVRDKSVYRSQLEPPSLGWVIASATVLHYNTTLTDFTKGGMRKILEDADNAKAVRDLRQAPG